MATDPDFAAYVADQMDEDCDVTYRKMFGEYGLYSHGVFFALICDDRLFVKRTKGGEAHIGDRLVEAPPYPGAKPIFLIEEGLEDRDWLSELVRITVRELPPPKAKKPKKSRKKGEDK